MNDEPKLKTKVDELRETEDVSADLKAAQEEAKQHYEKLLRVMAEFENFKKRTSRDVEDRIRYSNERLLSDLLPVIDDLDRVLEHVDPKASEDAKKIAEGVVLLRTNLLTTLEKYDLKDVGSVEERFDPAKHEAIAMVSSNQHEAETVIAVHRRGFLLGERLLRPALVSVAKKEGTC
ncbi:MAG: nucleotide exchange factor GrpE [Deltaproteobacteria bacterium]|nr:nucleotide exchange factor GrpE [Deltaproteobacteria bacterium]